MRLLKPLFTFAVFGLSLKAAWNPTCVSFVYVNGINTSNIDAAKTVTDYLAPQFQMYLTQKGNTTHCYSIHSSYNASEDIASDLLESGRLFFNQQTALSKFVNHNELLQTATTTEQAAFVYAITKTPKSNLVNIFAQTQVSRSTEIVDRLPRSEQITTGELVNKLLTEINAGNTAVCLGHSEGNFYCNLAYRVIAEGEPIVFQSLNVTQSGLGKLGLSLPNPKVLQIIGVADPANFLADGRNQYLTVCKDVILAVPNALPANSCGVNWWIELWSKIIPDLFGNDFIRLSNNGDVAIQYHLIETYLAPGSETQQRIMQMMEKSLSDALTTTVTYTLGPTNSDDVWITSVYYAGGMDNDECRIGGWGDWYYCLLKFNGTGMPLSVTKAELRLYKFTEGGNRSQIYLDRVTSSWTEATRWANKPSSLNLSTLPTPIDGQWYSIDITGLYNSWQSGIYPNYGIMMRPTYNGNDVHNTFHSSEYADSTLRPQLVLTYTASSPPVNTQPSITLLGANPMSINVGVPFVEPGYTASDKEDGNITSKVTISGSVNSAVPGTYTLSYAVHDSGGLSAVVQSRTVTVLALQSSGSVTYTLNPSSCSVVWITSVYYGFGQHDADMRLGGWGDWYYSLFKCDLTTLPKNATKVILRLWAYPSPSGNTRIQMYLDRITANWSNTTRWQTQPTATNITTLPVPVDNQWYEIDITALYNAWQSGTYPNYGIMLRPLANNDVFNVFRSTEYSDPTFRPQLVVSSSVTQPIVPVVPPVVPPPPPRLTGSCAVNGSLNTLSIQAGNTAYFGAGSSGGTGIIHYVWTNATGGDSTTASQYYASAGTYNASVTLSDSAPNKQQITVACPQVTVLPVPPPVLPFVSACSISPSVARTGTRATYAVAVGGGYTPYTYNLPGSNLIVVNNGAGTTITLSGVGTQTYAGFVTDARGQVTRASCSVTVTP